LLVVKKPNLNAGKWGGDRLNKSLIFQTGGRIKKEVKWSTKKRTGGWGRDIWRKRGKFSGKRRRGKKRGKFNFKATAKHLLIHTLQ